MKRSMFSLILCIMLAAMLIFPVSAEDRTGISMSGTPVIDGEIDDVWARSESYQIDLLKDGNDTGLTASFRMLWDASGVYFLIEVNDSFLSTEGGAMHENDGIELYLNPRNADATTFDDDDALLHLCVKALHPDEFELGETDTARDVYADNFKIGYKEVSGGYVFELAVDTKTACGISPAADMVMGVEIQINDQLQDSTGRDGSYGWNDGENKAWEDPSTFGKFTLSEYVEPEIIIEEVPADNAPAAADVSAPATADILIVTAAAGMAAAGAFFAAKKKR